MFDPLRFLVAVDDSTASSLAVAYAAEILPSLPDAKVVVLHALGALPPALAGSDPPTAQERDQQAAWFVRAREDAQPILSRAKSFFVDSGLAGEAIETHTVDCPSGDFADAILDAAADTNCGTIILGRDAISWAPQLLHRHVGENVVREGRGLVIWLVG